MKKKLGERRKIFKKWRKEHERLWGAIILIIAGIIAGIIIFLFLCPGPVIVVEPQKLGVSISPGNSTMKTILIEAIGIGDREVTLGANGPIARWIKFSENNEKFKNSITVEVDKTQYVNVNLSIPANTTPGDYRAAIEITHNYGKAEIPVLVKIEGNEKKRKLPANLLFIAPTAAFGNKVLLILSNIVHN